MIALGVPPTFAIQSSVLQYSYREGNLDASKSFLRKSYCPYGPVRLAATPGFGQILVDARVGRVALGEPN
jgi:hypothetical protein